MTLAPGADDILSRDSEISLCLGGARILRSMTAMAICVNPSAQCQELVHTASNMEGGALVRAHTSPIPAFRLTRTRTKAALSTIGNGTGRLHAPQGMGPVRTSNSSAAIKVIERCDSEDFALRGLEDLGDLLRCVGLEQYSQGVLAWCQQLGAAFLEEVWENRADLADALGLCEGAEERQRLFAALGPVLPTTATPSTGAYGQPTDGHGFPSKSGCAAAMGSRLHVLGLSRAKTVMVLPFSSGGDAQTKQTAGGSVGMHCTRTFPVTLQEVASVAAQVKKAYVPLRTWQHLLRSMAPKPSGQVLPHTSSKEAVLPAAPMEIDLDPQSHRQQKRGRQRMARCFRIKSADTMHAMKQRIPSPAELNALRDTQRRLMELMGDPSGPGQDQRDADKILDGKGPHSFQELQDVFISKYGPKIREELPGVCLQRANVSREVQDRFLSNYEGDSRTIHAAYHGTAVQNIEPILSKGLRVPGRGGVTVKHGSAHGVGIYTATLGSAWLSRSFCDSDQLLVCAVADDTSAADSNSVPATIVSAKATGTRSSGARFHRTHHRPVVPFVLAQRAGAPKMLGNLPVHKESKVVRHVGAAMVVFDEARVTPLFVAKCADTPATRSLRSPDYSRSLLWPSAADTNVLHRGVLLGGGVRTGTHQARVGKERLWLPPEKLDNRLATHLRRRREAKHSDVDRRARRDAKVLGRSMRF